MKLLIGERVRSIRKQLGLNQTEFAARIGMTQGYITSIERGTRDVNSRLVKLICETFSVSENWLFTGNGEMFQDNDHLLLANLTRKHKLNSAQSALLAAFFKLTPQQRDASIVCMKRMIEKNKGRN